MNLPILVYDCDQCGACCRRLIIECDHLDVLREPRIAVKGTLLDGHGKIPLEDAAWGLNQRNGNPSCVFLRDNKCSIYATRPNVCVNHQAGSEQCQDARKREGLPRLTPRKVSAPATIERIHELARKGVE